MLIQDQVNVFQWLLYIKIWWALVGTLSDFGTLFWHNTTKRCQTMKCRLIFLSTTATRTVTTTAHTTTITSSNKLYN